MAWIELHQAVARHPKTYSLAQILSQRRSTIIGMLCLLWLWALDNKTPKVNISPAALSDITDWTGDCDLLQKALVSCGWLDVTDEGLVIHDWEDYVGRLLLLREANRTRQKTHRLKLKLLTTGVGNSNNDITVTSQLRHGATVPNRTQPNHNKKYIKKKYGQFENVLLSDEEYEKLKTQFNNSLQEKIEELSTGIASKGYKYKSHYATILSWARKHEKEGGNGNGTYKGRAGGTRLIERHSYTEPPPDPDLDADIAESDRISVTTQHKS